MERKRYGLAYQTYCDYHGHEPSSEAIFDAGVPCFVCWYDISSPVRKCTHSHCDKPNIGIHDSCAKLPSEMEFHPLHSEDTLSLLAKTSSDSTRRLCDACGRLISWGFYFCCKMCNFHLDPHCASLFGNEMEMNLCISLKHPHPLMVRSLWDNESNLCCSGCKKTFEGFVEVYVCLECHFLLHKVCANQPSRIKHPFHSQHPLTLHIQRPSTSTSQYRCNACGSVPGGLFFNCSECNFSLDLSCSFLMPIQYREGMENHPHPLITCENIKRRDEIPEAICQGCKKCCEGPVYVCLHCRCVLDKSCAEWPQKIDHPFHPNHPLTLLVRHDPDSSRCKACGKWLHGLIFYCSECEFGLDLVCASLMPPQINQHHQLGHSHPLTLCKNKEKIDFTCYACQLRIKDSVYVCLECQIFLHRSCGNLPRKVYRSPHHKHYNSSPFRFQIYGYNLNLLEHFPSELESPFGCKQLVYVPEMLPIHPTYNADIARQALGQIPKQCSECLRVTTGFTYACNGCSDCFDIGCTMKKSKPHEHPLAFFTTTSNKLSCEICHRSLHTPFFRCAKCNYNIHISCVPILPQTVKCFHRHILSLRYSPVKDYADEDENAEFYCDICEELRELFDPSYYCEECHFVAHVHCVFSEEMRILVEEWSLDFKLDEIKLDTSSSPCEESASDQIMGKEVQLVAGSRVKGPTVAGNHSSLLELDEEIVLVGEQIKCIDAEISAMAQRKGEVEERLEELKKRRASSEFSSLFR